MSSLIILHNEYKNLMNSLLENEGEISQELEAMLSANLIESKDKVSNYIFVLSKCENEIEFTKEQIKKAQAYIARIEATKSKLEKIALNVVLDRGSKLEGNNGNWIGTRKSTKLEVFDKDLIPPVYLKIKVEVDNAGIKEALKRGETVAGAKLVENENINWK